MKTIKDGGPAFPCDELHDQVPPYRHLLASQGISIRDYFAAKAMQGEVAACSQQRAKPGRGRQVRLSGCRRHDGRAGGAIVTAPELLDQAAKAVGMRVIRRGEAVLPDGSGIWWSPLTDDGDLYRLARQLGISIDFCDCCAWKRMASGELMQEFWGGDCGEEAHAVRGSLLRSGGPCRDRRGLRTG